MFWVIISIWHFWFIMSSNEQVLLYSTIELEIFKIIDSVLIFISLLLIVLGVFILIF